MRILISGASVAGPALAYWLNRYGFDVTVVERAPAPRKTGGHAVDLFRPAMQIVERMGVAEEIRAKATGTDTLVIHRPAARPVTLDLRKMFTAVSDNHVEIMRDDLSEILYNATCSDVDYIFADSISAISDDGEVGFERSPAQRFDVIIGADGLHSNVRALVFGPESRFSTWLGAYLAIFSVPNYLNLDGVMEMTIDVGRVAGIYGAAHIEDGRAGFFLRPPQPLDYHYRDIDRQKQLLREHFGDMGWQVPRLLAELENTPSFYFDSIKQLRLDTWSRGRVGLVGDAAYCRARQSAAAPAWPWSVPMCSPVNSPPTPATTPPRSPNMNASSATMSAAAVDSPLPQPRPSSPADASSCGRWSRQCG